MSWDANPAFSSEPETYDGLLTFTGAGAGTPTKNYGKGMTVSYVSSGRYRLTFADFPGNFISPGGPNFQAGTPGNIKNYSAIFGAFDSTGKIVDIFVYNSSGTLTDLTSDQTVSFQMSFKRAEKTL